MWGIPIHNKMECDSNEYLLGACYLEGGMGFSAESLEKAISLHKKDAHTAAFSQTYTEPVYHLSALRHSNIWEKKSSITMGYDNH